MDKLTALGIFRAAAELRSFAAAGRRLALSPAAVSKNIAELESGLGARLFNRTTRRVSLTEAGLAYLERIAPLLDHLVQADESIGSMMHGPTGVLRVAAPVSFSIERLPKIAARFLSAYPGMSLHLDLDDRKVDIVGGGYDLAIRGSGRLEDSSLMARKLMGMPHVVCAAPAYIASRGMPSTPADLRQHECLVYQLSEHRSEWPFTRAQETARVPVAGRFAATSSLAVRDAAVEGLGLALLPVPYVAPLLADRRLVRVLADWTCPSASIYAIYPSRAHLAPKLRVFLQFLVEELEHG